MPFGEFLRATLILFPLKLFCIEDRDKNLLFRKLLRGGRNYILKWVFFVQSILADRYIFRRVETSIITKLVQRRIWN